MNLESLTTGFNNFEKARIYVESNGQQIDTSSSENAIQQVNSSTMKYFECMYSPSEFKEGYSPKWSEGDNQATKSFLGYNRDSLSLDIVFDSYQTPQGPQDVREDRTASSGGYGLLQMAGNASAQIYGVNKLKELFTPVESVSSAAKKTPPVLVFVWGDFVYRGLMEKLAINYTMFLPNGIPVRAKVNLVLAAYMSDTEAENALGKIACRKIRTTKSGQRLDLLAAQELKDATQWKLIARENGIKDMLVFPQKENIGQKIIIPDLPAAEKKQ